MKSLIFNFVLAIVFLTACSNPPSIGDARSIVERRIQDGGNGKIKLLSFKKTDGLAQEVMGMKCYTLMYVSEIEFTADCNWKGGYSTTERSDQTLFSGNPVRQGERKTINGSFEFVKTENGWRLQ